MSDVRLRNLIVLDETAKAWKFKQNQRSAAVEFYLPKSQIVATRNHAVPEGEPKMMSVSIPEWLFEKKAEEDGVQEL